MYWRRHSSSTLYSSPRFSSDPFLYLVQGLEIGTSPDKEQRTFATLHQEPEGLARPSWSSVLSFASLVRVRPMSLHLSAESGGVS